jgi:hypothetical protein
LEAQQHKKYAQTTPLGDGVSSLFLLFLIFVIFPIKILFQRVQALGSTTKIG